jgi:hypothetical protein
MPRSRKLNPNRLGKRERCDALLRRPWTKGPDGRFRLRHPRCQAWAMPNGRCRFHGGLSTGPRSPEGKARVVAAMVEGRRAWVERVHGEGGTFKSGRKSGARWLTEPMRERACGEARKLTGGWCPPFGPSDRKLVLALLRSANEDRRKAWQIAGSVLLDPEEPSYRCLALGLGIKIAHRMISHGLRPNARLRIENDADPAAPALRAHHAVLEVRDRHLAAPRPDQRLKVELFRVMALPGRVCLVNPAIDAFGMHAPSRRHRVAKSFDRHENK